MSMDDGRMRVLRGVAVCAAALVLAGAAAALPSDARGVRTATPLPASVPAAAVPLSAPVVPAPAELVVIAPGGAHGDWMHGLTRTSRSPVRVVAAAGFTGSSYLRAARGVDPRSAAVAFVASAADADTPDLALLRAATRAIAAAATAAPHAQVLVVGPASGPAMPPRLLRDLRQAASITGATWVDAGAVAAAP